MIVFACGLGDGTYPVWLGLTGDGEVAQIVAWRVGAVPPELDPRSFSSAPMSPR